MSSTGRSNVDRIAIAFSPGFVRIGTITARNDPWLDVEFPRRQRERLAVGEAVQVSLNPSDGHATPELSATVTERCDRASSCRYRLLLDGATGNDLRRNRPVAAPAHDHAVSIELRFGEVGHRAELLGWATRGARVGVTIHVEAALRSADALELVFRSPDGPSEGRLIGWIDRRVLQGDRVAYDFRIDEHLNEQSAVQRERLRRLIAATTPEGPLPP